MRRRSAASRCSAGLGERLRPCRQLARLRLTVARAVAPAVEPPHHRRRLAQAARDAVASDAPDLEVTSSVGAGRGAAAARVSRTRRRPRCRWRSWPSVGTCTVTGCSAPRSLPPPSRGRCRPGPATRRWRRQHPRPGRSIGVPADSAPRVTSPGLSWATGPPSRARCGPGGGRAGTGPADASAHRWPRPRRGGGASTAGRPGVSRDRSAGPAARPAAPADGGPPPAGAVPIGAWTGLREPAAGRGRRCRREHGGAPPRRPPARSAGRSAPSGRRSPDCAGTSGGRADRRSGPTPAGAAAGAGRPRIRRGREVRTPADPAAADPPGSRGAARRAEASSGAAVRPGRTRPVTADRPRRPRASRCPAGRGVDRPGESPIGDQLVDRLQASRGGVRRTRRVHRLRSVEPGASPDRRRRTGLDRSADRREHPEHRGRQSPDRRTLGRRNSGAGGGRQPARSPSSPGGPGRTFGPTRWSDHTATLGSDRGRRRDQPKRSTRRPDGIVLAAGPAGTGRASA